MDGTNDWHQLGTTLTDQDGESSVQFRRRRNVPSLERRIVTLLS